MVQFCNNRGNQSTTRSLNVTLSCRSIFRQQSGTATAAANRTGSTSQRGSSENRHVIHHVLALASHHRPQIHVTADVTDTRINDIIP